MVNVNIRVVARFGDIERYLVALPGKMKREIDDFASEIAVGGRRAVKKHVPVRTGRLRESIKSGVVSRVSGSAIPEKVVVIYSDSSYWHHVVFGTEPSHGRYVPAIGKRLVTGVRVLASGFIQTGMDIGIHPGIRPNRFFEKGFVEYWHTVKNMMRDVARRIQKR